MTDRALAMSKQVLSASVKKVGDVAVVSLSGTLTIDSGTFLSDTLKEVLKDGTRKIVLDMAKMTRIDSAGIGELAAAYTHVSVQGAKLILASPSAKVGDVLEITSMSRVLPPVDTVEAALESLK
jgi:anti-anti-sigma factor